MMAKKSINDGHNEETRIALLEQSIDHINESLRDIKEEMKLGREEMKRFIDKMDSKFDKMDSKFSTMDSKIDSHFRWTVGLIFGLYGTVVATLITALGKASHWF